MPTDSYSARDYYQGEVAATYTDHRVRSEAALLKWERESSAATQLLSKIPAGSRVADLPCGDGRFADVLTGRGLRWIGVDISHDMIRAGLERHDSMATAEGFLLGDAERLPMQDGAVDHVLCARFANLVPISVLERVLTEFRRVTTQGVVLEIRLAVDAPWAGPARRGRALVNAARTRVQGGGDVEASKIRRDPLRVHPERTYREVLARTGWRETERVEVVTSRWPLRTDPLFFVRLDPTN